MLIARLITVMPVNAIVAIFTVTVTILAILTILTILTIFAVAVVVAVFLLLQVNAIQNDVYVRQLVVVVQVVDESEVRTRRIVGTADNQGYVSYT